MKFDTLHCPRCSKPFKWLKRNRVITHGCGWKHDMVAELRKYNALGSHPPMPTKYEKKFKPKAIVDQKSINDKVIGICIECGVRTLFKSGLIHDKCVFCRKDT